MVGQQDTGEESGGTGSAAHAERDFVVELEVKTRGQDAGVGQHVHVGGEDEVVFEAGAEVGVAAGGVDVEVLRDGGVDGEVEGHGQTEGVEAGAEVGGGRGQAEVKRFGLGVNRRGSCGLGLVHVGLERAED